MRIENCGCGGSCGGCSAGLGEGEWWKDLIKQGVDTASSVVSSRYGVPPQGSAVYRGSDGSYQFVRTGAGLPGASIGTFGATGGVDTDTLLIVGATILGGILIFKAIK